MTLRTNFISEVFAVILLGMCLNGGLSYPASNTNSEPSPDQPVEVAQGPREVRDSFSPGKLVRPPFLSNDVKKSQAFKPGISKFRGNDVLFDAVPLKGKSVWRPKSKPYKVKPAHALKPQKNVLRQNDDDDDDDDDGGEYGGAGDSCKNDKKSMPMMIIRGFDVMAMDLPVSNGKKECKNPAPPVEVVVPDESGSDENTGGEDDKIGSENISDEEDTPAADTPCNVTPEVETTVRDTCALRDSMDPASYMSNDNVSNDQNWGDWSSCSKSCGVGMQSRSRLNPSGSPERDTQFKPCFLSNCPGEPGLYDASPMIPSGYGDRDSLKP